MTKRNTSTDEFEKWLALLPFEPWLIPIRKNAKDPDIPKGESTKDPKWRLNKEEAHTRIKEGFNVGVMSTGDDYIFFDHDDPTKFLLERPTLTVLTRNGKIHKHYINGGDVENGDGKGKYKDCGEVRAKWKYVLTPGSFVPLDDKALDGATGLYKIIKATPLTILHAQDIPIEFHPSFAEAQTEIPSAKMTGSFRNQYGWSIEQLRDRDNKLDVLLSSLQPTGYPSPSEADMACIAKLLYWGYTNSEAVDILKVFRNRDKLHRDDYIKMTLNKIVAINTIANDVDPSKWNPTTGYKLPMEMEPETSQKGLQFNFKVVSENNIKVRAVKDQDTTAWVTIASPERLRTSRNAEILRYLLKGEHPTDWRIILEQTVKKIQQAVDNFKGEAEQKEKEEVDEETQRKAHELLEDIAFFYKLGKVFHWGYVIPKLNKPRFLIGEERNKRVVGPLLIGAGKLGMTSIIKVLGGIGTAKDTMLRLWLELLPLTSLERSYMTAASMRYSEHLKGSDLMYVPDSPALKGEMGRHMRFMRADDGGLISEYAMKEPGTGEMITKTVRLPVKGIATTSNAVTADTALESGMWTLKTNDSEALTHEVKKEKLRFRAGKRPLFPEAELKVWRFAFKILLTEKSLERMPTIPYAQNLITILESKRSASRRDPDKLCDLICLIAWMRRFQKAKESRDRADVGDLYFALQLGLDAITETISDLGEQEERIHRVVRKAETPSVSVHYVDNQIPEVGYHTCYSYLEKLVKKGFLSKDKEGGKNVYSAISGQETPNLFISQSKRFDEPKLLMEYVLASFHNSSSLIQDTPLNLIDPITGETVTVKHESETLTIVSEPVSDELKYYPFPPQEKKSGERGKETPSNIEKDSSKLFDWKSKKDLEQLPALSKFADLDKIKSVVALSEPEEGPCTVCNQNRVLPYQIEDFEGLWGLVCQDCGSSIMQRLKKNG